MSKDWRWIILHQRFTPKEKGISVSSSGGIRLFHNCQHRAKFQEQFWTQKLPWRTLLTVLNNDCKEITQERQAFQIKGENGNGYQKTLEGPRKKASVSNLHPLRISWFLGRYKKWCWLYQTSRMMKILLFESRKHNIGNAVRQRRKSKWSQMLSHKKMTDHKLQDKLSGNWLQSPLNPKWLTTHYKFF